MFEYLKDYSAFRTQLREVKTETFQELKQLLDENQKLTRRVKDLEAKHERDVMTLAHQLTLEKERFELEKERVRSTEMRAIMQEREKIPEKNFHDLTRLMETQHHASMEILQAVVSRVTETRMKIIELALRAVSIRDGAPPGTADTGEAPSTPRHPARGDIRR